MYRAKIWISSLVLCFGVGAVAYFYIAKLIEPKDAIALSLGVIGAVLGISNSLQQALDRAEKRRNATQAYLSVQGPFLIEDGTKKLRCHALWFDFGNSLANDVRICRVKILSPKRGWIDCDQGAPSKWARLRNWLGGTVSVDWAVSGGHKLEKMGPRPIGGNRIFFSELESAAVPRSDEFVLVFWGYEVGERQAPIKVIASAIHRYSI